jgi:hypothetical protein
VSSSARYSPPVVAHLQGSYSVHLHAIKENQKTDHPTGYSPFYTPDPSVWHERIQGFAKPHTRDFRALAVGIPAGFLFEFLHTPIPWMVGPMVGVASLNLMGVQMHSPRTPVKWVK